MHTRILIMTDTPEEFKKKFLDVSWYRVQPAKNAKETREDHRKIFLLDEYPVFDATEMNDEDIKLFFYIASVREVRNNPKWIFESSCALGYDSPTLSVIRQMTFPTGKRLKTVDDFMRVSEIVHNYVVLRNLQNKLIPSKLNAPWTIDSIKPFNFLE